MKRSPMVAFLSEAALAGGCGTDEDSYKLVRVTGTVTKNGKPLSDAKVSFVPDASNAHPTPGVDQTGPQGNYMVTFKGRTGVAPGKYKVIVTPAIELPGGGKVPPEFEKQPGMFLIGQEAADATKKKSADVKKAVVKSEFDREVEDQAAGVTLDFDVKSS